MRRKTPVLQGGCQSEGIILPCMPLSPVLLDRPHKAGRGHSMKIFLMSVFILVDLQRKPFACSVLVSDQAKGWTSPQGASACHIKVQVSETIISPGIRCDGNSRYQAANGYGGGNHYW